MGIGKNFTNPSKDESEIIYEPNFTRKIIDSVQIYLHMEDTSLHLRPVEASCKRIFFAVRPNVVDL